MAPVRHLLNSRDTLPEQPRATLAPSGSATLIPSRQGVARALSPAAALDVDGRVGDGQVVGVATAHGGGERAGGVGAQLLRRVGRLSDDRTNEQEVDRLREMRMCTHAVTTPDAWGEP